MAEPTDVPALVSDTLAALSDPRPMRRGSLSERRMKCNKPGCPCVDNPDARHGPYFSLTRAVEGRTRSRLLTTDQARLVREQVEAGKRFRRRVDTYWDACEKWADAELEGARATSQGVAEKGGSKKPSRRRSSRKSKR
jgi:hypothetical protein